MCVCLLSLLVLVGWFTLITLGCFNVVVLFECDLRLAAMLFTGSGGWVVC